MMAFGSGMSMFRKDQIVLIMDGDFRGNKGRVVHINYDGSAKIRLDGEMVVDGVWPEDCEPVEE